MIGSPGRSETTSLATARAASKAIRNVRDVTRATQISTPRPAGRQVRGHPDGTASAISGPDITIAGTTVTGVPRAITELLRNSASVVEVTAEWVEERWALVPGEVVRINTLPGGFIASGTTVSERATSAAPTTPAAAAQRTPRPAAHASAGLAGVTRARPAFAGLAAAHAATDPRASSRSGPQVSGRHRVAQSFPDCDF
jgi:hypothetical protein